MIGADIEDFPIKIGKGEAVQEFENKVEKNIRFIRESAADTGGVYRSGK